MRHYVAVFEKMGNNYSVFIPDIPAIAATGHDKDEAYDHIVTAFQTYVRGVGVEGLPEPRAFAMDLEWNDRSK